MLLAQGWGLCWLKETPPPKHPVMFLSRKLNKAEKAYSVIEREALAIKWTLRYYLLGVPFKLVTDHAPLTELQRMRESNTCLIQWYMALQTYAFTVQ